MSIFRLLILTGVVLALVPVKTEQRVEFFNSVQQRTSYLMSACDRDPEFCNKAAQSLTDLKHHTQHALVMGFSLIRLVFTGKEIDRNEAIAIPARDAVTPAPTTTGTLSPTDRATAWSAQPR